jgi:NADH dehydrogenase [ubiquinone] 1 alpha subcomplex assembly factor 5
MANADTRKIEIFDRKLVRIRRDRAARNFASFDFLCARTIAETCDRLTEIKRDFTSVLDCSAANGLFAKTLQQNVEYEEIAKNIELLVQSESSIEMARRADQVTGGLTLVSDEEFVPFAEASFDLAVSFLAMHFVNDLPGALLQIKRALKPDGIFIASLFGGDTLTELKQVLMEAQIEVEGGASPLIAPFADIRDIGALLQRAGFALPVTDLDRVTVHYATMFDLLKDLRGMGQTNVLIERRKKPLGKEVLFKAAELYHHKFAGPDGKIPATFDIIYATGWSPHGSQQKPLQPGSGKIPFAEAIKTASNK